MRTNSDTRKSNPRTTQKLRIAKIWALIFFRTTIWQLNWTFPSWLAGCWAVEGGIKLATAWNTSILGKNHWTSLPSSNQTWQLKTPHLYRNYRGIPHENFHICRRFPIAMFEYQRVNQIPDSSPEQPSRLWTKYRPSKVRCIRRSPSTYSNLQDRSGFQGLSRTTPPAFDVSRFYLGPFLEGLAHTPLSVGHLKPAPRLLSFTCRFQRCECRLGA